jgi:hypothetical protein
MGDGRFKPGQRANPNGRPVGSRYKRDVELLARLEARGDRLAVDLLSEIGNNKNEAAALRIQALGIVAQYQSCRLGLIPAPVPPVYVTEPVELPHPHATEIRHAIENIEHLSALRQTGKLDLVAADALISDQRLIRDGLVEEHKALIAQGGPKDQRIEIVGGLPKLPGTDIDLEGQYAARVAAAQAHPAVVNGEAVRPDLVAGPPVPFIPPEGSPLAEKPGQPKHPVGDKPGDDDPSS